MKRYFIFILFLLSFLIPLNVNASTTGNLTFNRVRYYSVNGINMYQSVSNNGSVSISDTINNSYIYFKANNFTNVTDKYVIFSGFSKAQQTSSSDSPIAFAITPIVLMNGSLDNANSCFMSKSNYNTTYDGNFQNVYISWVVSCKLSYPLNGANDSNILHFSTVTGSRQMLISTYINERFYITDDPFDDNSQQIINSIDNSTNSITNSIDSVDDSIKNDSVDSSDDTLNNLNSKLATNNVISDLLLLPVTLYQKIINSLNGSCSSFNLGSLYNHNLTLPCINLQNYLGSSIFTTIDLIISGLFVLVIRKKFVDIFNNMTNLKNGGNEVE